jgi:hypothetical protein
MLWEFYEVLNRSFPVWFTLVDLAISARTAKPVNSKMLVRVLKASGVP